MTRIKIRSSLFKAVAKFPNSCTSWDLTFKSTVFSVTPRSILDILENTNLIVASPGLSSQLRPDLYYKAVQLVFPKMRAISESNDQKICKSFERWSKLFDQ